MSNEQIIFAGVKWFSLQRLFFTQQTSTTFSKSGTKRVNKEETFLGKYLICILLVKLIIYIFAIFAL